MNTKSILFLSVLLTALPGSTSICAMGGAKRALDEQESLAVAPDSDAKRARKFCPRATKEFLDAAFIGDKASMSKALKEGADVNALGENGLSALHLAAQDDHEDPLGLIDFLLKKGADINNGNSDGLTPIWSAAYQNAPEIVEFLILRGADLGVLDGNGLTLLHRFAEFEGFNIVRALENNKNLNVSKYLSFCLDIKDDKGLKPFQRAIDVGQIPSAKKLIALKLINKLRTRRADRKIISQPVLKPALPPVLTQIVESYI